MSEAKTSKDHYCYLGIGSNISPEVNIPRAIALLRKYVEVEAISTIWESPPEGGSGPNFLNAAVLIQTDLDEEDLRSRELIPELMHPTNGESLRKIARRLTASTSISRRRLDLAK
ncbi:MAG: 2-amino-4-hydroxy-6-hydroxymethyldihydropteridine diphosphokinase [Anaerolineales bacterium]